MKYFIVSLVLLFAIIFETSLIQLPLVLLSLLLLGVLWKEQWIFLAAFLAGSILDIAAFRTVGISSLFFIAVLGVVFLYERKFEIQSIPFVIVATLLSTSLYFFFFGSTAAILQVLVSIGISTATFLFLPQILGNTLITKKGYL